MTCTIQYNTNERILVLLGINDYLLPPTPLPFGVPLASVEAIVPGTSSAPPLPPLKTSYRSSAAPITALLRPCRAPCIVSPNLPLPLPSCLISALVQLDPRCFGTAYTPALLAPGYATKILNHHGGVYKVFSPGELPGGRKREVLITPF